MYGFHAKTVIEEEGRTSWAAVNEIMEWALATSLPELTEELVVLFLIACNNVLADAKLAIEAYFRIRRGAPEIFDERNIDNDDQMQKSLQTIYLSSLPVRMKNNTVIHYFKLADTNFRNLDLISCMKLSYMLVDVSQHHNPPNEVVVLIDMEGASLLHLTCMKLKAVKKYIDYIQDALPLKIRIIHVLNCNYVFDKILAIARTLVRHELIALVRPHQPGIDMEEFYKEWIPAECLPKEYGGKLPSIDELQQRTIEQFRELKPYFEAEEKQRSFYK